MARLLSGCKLPTPRKRLQGCWAGRETLPVLKCTHAAAARRSSPRPAITSLLPQLRTRLKHDRLAGEVVLLLLAGSGCLLLALPRRLLALAVWSLALGLLQRRQPRLKIGIVIVSCATGTAAVHEWQTPAGPVRKAGASGGSGGSGAADFPPAAPAPARAYLLHAPPSAAWRDGW